jgi:MFS transporter, DHA1 family, multidrug resistance protein
MSVFARLCAVGFFARFSYALARNPVLPLFALFLGAGPEAIGLAVGVSTVTGIVFKLPSGALSDVFGRRRAMLAGLVFFAAVPFFYVFITDYSQLILVRFIHGLATAIYGPVAMAVVADVAGAKKGEMLSWFSSVMIVGTLLGAPIGGFMLHHAPAAAAASLGDFRLVFLVSGLAGAVSLVLGLATLTGGDTVSPGVSLAARFRAFAAGIREVGGDRRVLIVSAMEGLQNMVMGALEAFLPIYAVTVAGLNEFEAGALWGVQVVMTMLAKPILGRLSDRLGRKAIIVSGLAACAVSFAAIPHLAGFAGLLGAALVFGLGEALVSSSTAAMIADLCAKRHLGAAMGTFGTIFDIGHASGPILAGFLVARLGFAVTFAVMAAILLAALPVFVRGVRTGD